MQFYSIHRRPVLTRHEQLVLFICHAYAIETVGILASLSVQSLSVIYLHNLPIDRINGNQYILVPNVGIDQTTIHFQLINMMHWSL